MVLSPAGFDKVNKNENLLLDTGSAVSLIKNSSLPINAVLNDKDKMKLLGISFEQVHTLGSTNLALVHTNNIIINFRYQIVEDNFPINCDGILGSDFLEKYKAVISYLDKRVFIPSYKVYLKMYDYSEGNPCMLLRQTKYFTTKDQAKDIEGPSQLCSLSRVEQTATVEKLHKDKDIIYDQTRADTLVNIISQNCPLKYLDGIRSLIEKYQDIFILGKEPITFNNFYVQKLHLKTDPNNPDKFKEPIFVDQFINPHAHLAIIDRKVEELLDQDIIEPSNSLYNAPVLIVPKKSPDGSDCSRMVVDFRKLAFTVTSSFQFAT